MTAKYKILESDQADYLAENVQGHLAEGWEPAGGISVTSYGEEENWWYAQAMILRDEK